MAQTPRGPEIEITWGNEDLATTRLFQGSGGVPDSSLVNGDDVRNFFSDYFRDETSIRVRVVEGGQSGSLMLDARPTQRGRGMKAVIVKIGPADAMKRESENARTIADDLGQQFLARVVQSTITVPARGAAGGEISALFYQFEGRMSLAEALGEAIAGGQFSMADLLVDRLLGTMAPWHAALSAAQRSLHKDGLFGFAGSRELTAFEDWCTASGDPALAVGSKDVLDFWRNGRPVQHTLLSRVHGDLHHDNVRVRDDDGIALIDFGSFATEGHFLRDLVTLEAHYLVRALCPHGEFSDAHRVFYESLTHVLTANSFRSPFSLTAIDPRLRPVARLRRYAFAALAKGNGELMAQYAFGVMRHAVALTARRESGGSFSEGQRWFAAKIAVRIAHQLNHKDVEKVSFPRSNDHSAALSFLDMGIAANDFGYLGAPVLRPWGVLGGNQHPARANSQWHDLSRAILSAVQVDLLGHVPWPLMSALVETAQQIVRDRGDDGPPKAPAIRYMRNASAIESVHLQRWSTGVIAAANLHSILHYGIYDNGVLKIAANPNSSINEVVSFSDVLDGGCAIRVAWRGGDVRVIRITDLQSPLSHPDAAGISPGPFFVAELENRSSVVGALIDESLRRPTEHARLYELLVRTAAGNDVSSGADVPFELEALVPYGAASADVRCVQPISLVIPWHTQGKRGAHLVLVTRTARTDIDGWGKLSYPSARLLSRDVKVAYGNELKTLGTSDMDLEFHEVMERCGGMVGVEAMKEAARRAIIERGPLDLPQDRFVLQGVRYSGRSDGSTLAFVVFSLKLEAAEVASWQKWGRGVFSETFVPVKTGVPIADFSPKNPSANGFTITHHKWLEDTVFPTFQAD